MIGYATTTGTRRNIAAMRRFGWHILVTPDTWRKGHGPKGLPYALDNGAWGAFNSGREWPEADFLGMLAEFGAGARWVVLPDIVAGGLESLRVSLSWLPRLLVPPLRLLAVQDGMQPEDVRPYLGPTVGLFVGGSQETDPEKPGYNPDHPKGWKEETMRMWGQLARDAGCYFHVARVNSARRITLCQDCGADSFDGTSPTRYAKNTPRLSLAVGQGHLFGGIDR